MNIYCSTQVYIVQEWCNRSVRDYLKQSFYAREVDHYFSALSKIEIATLTKPIWNSDFFFFQISSGIAGNISAMDLAEQICGT
mgnify:CR=1 FL=1